MGSGSGDKIGFKGVRLLLCDDLRTHSLMKNTMIKQIRTRTTRTSRRCVSMRLCETTDPKKCGGDFGVSSENGSWWRYSDSRK